MGKWLSVDPFVNKYPELSPYCYVANSPLLFIDPDGKQIIIHYKDNTGAPQIHIVGTEDIPDNQFVRDVLTSITYLEKSVTAKPIVTELTSMNTQVHIKEATKFGDTEFTVQTDEKGDDQNTIHYNPREGLAVVNKGTGEKGKQTAALGFLHEGAHALQYIKNPKQFFKDFKSKIKKYHTKEEKRVIDNIETPAAIELGEGIRDNHYGTPLRTFDPGSTDFYKDNINIKSSPSPKSLPNSNTSNAG